MDVRTALVFGASGFTGRAVVRRFTQAGFRVQAVSRRPQPGPAHPLVTPHRLDGSAEETFRVIFAGDAIDIAVHLAAPAGVVPANGIAEAASAAVTSLAALMAAAAEARCGRVVMAGSYWQYGSDGVRAPPATLYAALKNAADDVAAFFARRLSIVELVLFDSYGPGDDRGKIFDLVRDAANRKEPLRLTPGEQILRPIHVDDVAEAFLAAARLPVGPGLHRFWVPGPEAMTLRQAVERFCRGAGLRPDLLWGARPYPEHRIFAPFVGETPPGWSARIPFDTGVLSLVEAAPCP